jgi:hypothetical protein
MSQYDNRLLPREWDGLFTVRCNAIIWHCGCGAKADDIVHEEEGFLCWKCGSRARWEERAERVWTSSDGKSTHRYEVAGDFTFDVCDERWESAGHANEAYGTELVSKQDHCPCCGASGDELEVESA